MLPVSTTTTGDSLQVMHINAFHIIRAEVTIMPVNIFCTNKRMNKPQKEENKIFFSLKRDLTLTNPKIELHES